MDWFLTAAKYGSAIASAVILVLGFFFEFTKKATGKGDRKVLTESGKRVLWLVAGTALLSIAIQGMQDAKEARDSGHKLLAEQAEQAKTLAEIRRSVFPLQPFRIAFELEITVPYERSTFSLEELAKIAGDELTCFPVAKIGARYDSSPSTRVKLPAKGTEQLGVQDEYNMSLLSRTFPLVLERTANSPTVSVLSVFSLKHALTLRVRAEYLCDTMLHATSINSLLDIVGLPIEFELYASEKLFKRLKIRRWSLISTNPSRAFDYAPPSSTVEIQSGGEYGDLPYASFNSVVPSIETWK